MESKENTVTVYRASADDKRKFLSRTYAWMGLALVLSAVCAYAAAVSPAIFNLIWGRGAIGFIILAVAELAVVWIFSATIRKMSVGGAIFCFILYSVINGLTLSSIFFAYHINTIAYCFLGAAVMFGAMSIYGSVTKSSLASAGHYLMMGLIGIILVSVINMLVTFILKMSLGWVEWLISLATVVIFTGLTAFDSQKILKAANRADRSDAYKKLAIYGALELYLDFINIFLSLLRLFGRNRD